MLAACVSGTDDQANKWFRAGRRMRSNVGGAISLFWSLFVDLFLGVPSSVFGVCYPNRGRRQWFSGRLTGMRTFAHCVEYHDNHIQQKTQPQTRQQKNKREYNRAQLTASTTKDSFASRTLKVYEFPLGEVLWRTFAVIVSFETGRIASRIVSRIVSRIASRIVSHMV